MSTAIAVAGSLLGVVIGGSLTAWLAHRAEIRKLFLDAIRSLSYVSAASEMLTTWTWRAESTPDPEVSRRLTEHMQAEHINATLDVRRALAAVAPFCAAADEHLRHWVWEEILSPDIQAKLQADLRKELHRRLWRW